MPRACPSRAAGERATLVGVRWRLAIAVAASLLVAAAAAPPAPAKGDVRATLTTVPPTDAEPGSTVTVAWTLQSVHAGVREPFGAGGVFVQLRSATGAAATIADATGRGGAFRARATVPEGGIGGLRIGLRGWTFATGAAPAQRRAAPRSFVVENDPFAAGARAASDGPPLPWIVVALGLGGLALALAARRALTARGAVA